MSLQIDPASMTFYGGLMIAGVLAGRWWNDLEIHKIRAESEIKVRDRAEGLAREKLDYMTEEQDKLLALAAGRVGRLLAMDNAEMEKICRMSNMRSAEYVKSLEQVISVVEDRFGGKDV